MNRTPTPEFLLDIRERLEALCDSWGADDLKQSVAILEQLALENPGLETLRPQFERILDADDRLSRAKKPRGLDKPLNYRQGRFRPGIVEVMATVTEPRLDRHRRLVRELLAGGSALTAAQVAERLGGLSGSYTAGLLFGMDVLERIDGLWRLTPQASLTPAPQQPRQRDDPMSKRAPRQFERRDRDFYPTPRQAVLPLVPFLHGVRDFAEPCRGDGDLVWHLEWFGLRCTHAGDIRDGNDALATQDFGGVPVITNPPWSRPVLHAMIGHFMANVPFAWLLIDLDWCATKQAVPFMARCSDIVVVGRVKWISGSPSNGLDNVAWFRFEHGHRSGPIFHNGDSLAGAQASGLACAACGKSFTATRSDAKTCSDRCRQRLRRGLLKCDQP